MDFRVSSRSVAVFSEISSRLRSCSLGAVLFRISLSCSCFFRSRAWLASSSSRRILHRIRKMGKFFINNVTRADDDQGKETQAQVPEQGVALGLFDLLFLLGRVFLRGVFGNDVQRGLQTFFRSAGRILFPGCFIPFRLGGEAGFVFLRGGRIGGGRGVRGGIGHGERRGWG